MEVASPILAFGSKSHNSQDREDLWTPFKVIRGSENNLRRGEVKEPRKSALDAMGAYLPYKQKVSGSSPLVRTR